jgi:hypothetical protein
MAGLDPAIHAAMLSWIFRRFLVGGARDVDARVKPWHDDLSKAIALAKAGGHGDGCPLSRA